MAISELFQEDVLQRAEEHVIKSVILIHLNRQATVVKVSSVFFRETFTPKRNCFGFYEFFKSFCEVFLRKISNCSFVKVILRNCHYVKFFRIRYRIDAIDDS